MLEEIYPKITWLLKTEVIRISGITMIKWYLELKNILKGTNCT